MLLAHAKEVLDRDLGKIEVFWPGVDSENHTIQLGAVDHSENGYTLHFHRGYVLPMVKSPPGALHDSEVFVPSFDEDLVEHPLEFCFTSHRAGEASEVEALENAGADVEAINLAAYKLAQPYFKGYSRHVE